MAFDHDPGIGPYADGRFLHVSLVPDLKDTKSINTTLCGQPWGPSSAPSKLTWTCLERGTSRQAPELSSWVLIIVLHRSSIHPNLNNDFLSNMAWTYAMYLESVALIPQLYMFQKQSTRVVVELLTAHFVATL